MKVTNIVNEESERVWLKLLLREVAQLALHGLVDEGALVVASALQPVDDGWDHQVDWLGVEHETWVIIDASTLVKVGSVNEMPSGLPGGTLGLDLVSECGAFNEGIVSLKVGHAGVWAWVDLKKIISLVQGGFALIGELQLIVGNSCNYNQQQH